MMRIFGQFIFWLLTFTFFALCSAFIVVSYDYPIWTGFLIFSGITLLFFIVTAISRSVSHWYSKLKTKKQKAIGEKIETGGLNLTLNNLINYIHKNDIAGGEKRFKQMPWVLFLGSSKAIELDIYKLHTHFKVGDSEDVELQLNKAVVLENEVTWFVDEALLKSNTPKKIEQQWQDFLKAIKKYKYPESALRQIVVEIPARLLMSNDKTQLSYYACTLRDRVNQVSSLTGYRQKILFLISGCQELEGFNAYISSIPENMRHQGMGYVLDDPVGSSSSRQSLQQIVWRLQDVIDIVLFNSEYHVDTQIFNFPLSIDKLIDNYALFTELFFAQNSYSESPFLMGIYLTGIYECKGTNELAFMYDFIDKIQVAIMCPMIPLCSELKKQRIQTYKKMALWYLFGFFIAGYLIYNYTQTNKRLIDLMRLIPAKRIYTNNLEENLLEFNGFYALMHEVDKFKNQWQIKILPYRGGLVRLYDYFSVLFVNQFNQHVVKLLDDRIVSLLRQRDVSDRQKAYIVQNLISRINIIQLKLSGAKRETLQKMSSPEIKYLGYENILDEIQNAFGLLYKNYIFWNNRDDSLRIQFGTLKRWLEDSGYLRSDLRWLIEWGNTRPDIHSVSLNNFWLGSISIRRNEIPPGYTSQGELAIEQLLAEIEYALPLDGNYVRRRKLFEVWYDEEHITKWKQFILNFNQGEQSLAYQFEWDQTFDEMLTPGGPYFAMIYRVDSEFQNNLHIKTPRWIDLAHKFAELLNYRYESEQGIQFKEISSVFSKWMMKFNTRPSELKEEPKARNGMSPPKLKREVSTQATPSLTFNDKIDAAKAYMTYRGLLKKLYDKPFVQTVKAYAASKNLYESQSSYSKDSDIIQAYQALIDIRRSLDHYDQLDDGNPFWLLMRGPIDFYLDYINRYASCYIQQKWLDEVYLQSVSAEGEELNTLLFGKEGIIWNFHENYTKAFIRQVGKNYVPIRVLNHKFPLTTDYYHFLTYGSRIDIKDNQGAEVKKQLEAKLPTDITIKTKPVNLSGKRPKSLPYKTTLNIKCSDKLVTLNNYNYPSQKTIRNWTLDSCGPVEINIYLPAATLSINYAGNDGFLHFLLDYAKGGVSYPVKYFPDHAKYLRDNNIDAIQVYYSLGGARDVVWQISKYLASIKQEKAEKIKFAQKTRVPRVIAQCWKQGT
ncbi:TPA: hypothetical protein I8034_003052 [Legionella pneumophila]|nr:hypothetical protein [Legionella pneumophila]HAT2137532.1 hypothetical protein [Legionella pneumophila]HAT2146791.1 hypothetical protein [Legionella pneumophila]HAT2161912.1 hypothetical protein [Legionella pneumophila]HAT3987349.1 hypothetical protein [Legionella pneumophila]